MQEISRHLFRLELFERIQRSETKIFMFSGEILPKSSAIIHGNEIPRLTKYSQSEEEERDRIEEETNAILERRHRGRGKFSCLSCQPPDCDHVKYCHNAVRCYTAHVRDDDGTEHKSKGKSKVRRHF